MDLRFIKYAYLMCFVVAIQAPLITAREYLFGRFNPSKSEARIDHLIRKGDLYIYLTETHMARYTRTHPR